MVGAVDKHLALIGFMGAGKSTLGRELAHLTHRPFVDTDEEIEKRFGPIGELFERGEPEFRRIEEQVVAEALAGPTVGDRARRRSSSFETTRERLARTAFVAWVPVDVDTAWSRVGGSAVRSLETASSSGSSTTSVAASTAVAEEARAEASCSPPAE